MKPRAALWVAGMIMLAGVLAALIASGRFQLQTDLLTLLPHPDRDPVRAAAVERIASLGQKRLVLLAQASDPASRERATSAAAQTLANSRAFSRVATRTGDWLQAGDETDLYFQHRFHLLAPGDRRALQRLAAARTGDEPAPTHFTERARTRLYGIRPGGARFVDDPFGLARAYRNSLMQRAGAPDLRVAADGHFYVAGENGERFAVVFAKTRQDPFSIAGQSRQIEALNKSLVAASEAAPGAEILASGVVRHAAAATDRARTEVTWIGTGSLVGILLLMLWAFRGLRPFALSLIAVASGCLLALAVTAALFGGIHTLTLVFGASLVGVAIDYCFHLFTRRWADPAPDAALRAILPAITLGLITSVLAYGAMAIAPFPGLRQMAVFAACGLIGAWLTVVLLLPALAGPAPRPGAALGLARAWLARGPPAIAGGRGDRLLWALALLLVGCAALAAAVLEPDDDIRLLNQSPEQLVADERRIAELMGTRATGRAIVMRGASKARVLADEDALVTALRSPQQPVADVSALTDRYPPPATQRQDYRLLQQTLYAPDGPAEAFLRTVGFDQSAIAAHTADFRAAKDDILRFQRWRRSAAGEALGRLWLGRFGDRWASLVLVHQVHDEAALSRILAAQPRADAVNRIDAASRLLGRYRSLVTRLLAGAYAVAALLLWRLLGLRGAVIVLMPPLLASVATALVFAITGWPFSLFNLMAMILLLGLGADYGIFLRLSGRDRAPAMAAVGLSALTTLLAFGLLAASRTPALHGFGLTLALGLSMTFVLASLLGGLGQTGRNKHNDGR